MTYREEAILFECHGDSLVGIVAHPKTPKYSTGVIIVVGGPQYRIGSHRQFVQLERDLAQSGVPTLRFDCRGMGDSDGESRLFTEIGDDIEASINAFYDCRPDVRGIYLWGLCDGATAAALYAQRDERVLGLILVNPWVRTAQTEAQTYLKHYYRERVQSIAFWRKFLTGQINWTRSFSEAFGLLKTAFISKPKPGSLKVNRQSDLPELVYESLINHLFPIHAILSGKDLVANEFEDLITQNTNWAQLSETLTIDRIADADHTFSEQKTSERAIRSTLEWLTRQESLK